MLTVSTSASFKSTTYRAAFEITKTPSPLPAICSRPNVEQAHSSFTPARSAAKSLRDFAGNHTTILPRTHKKRRRVTFQETSSPVSSDDDDFTPSFQIARHARPPKKGYQNRVMTSPLINGMSQDINPSGMHPILAKLERQSKLCTQMVYCSTCGKSGHDYPRCGKCGVMWCSRTCRLVAGKRHICPPIH
jgi:hypothetical protein